MMPVHSEPLTTTAAHLAGARRFPLTVEQEDDGWVARTPHPAFAYLVAAGDTPEAAAAALVQYLAGQPALAEHQGRGVPSR